MQLHARGIDIKHVACWLAASAGVLAAPLARGDILGIQHDASVYSINEVTGAATLLSNNPTFAANAMAKSSYGIYYTAGGLGNGSLNTINPTTGVITAGPDIYGPDNIRGLAFSPDNTLYATIAGGSPSASLYTIDVSSGATKLIAAVGPMQALTFSPSGTLYGWSSLLGLVTLDPVTGAVTDVDASTGSTQTIQTLAFSPGGVLYAGAEQDLHTVDVSTGVLTLVAPIAPVNDLRGMEFIGIAPIAPGVSLTPSPLLFGNQIVGTTSAPQALTLTNVGSAALLIASISASGDFAQTNDCGPSINPAANCTINVSFTPMMTGPRNGAVTMASNAASSPNLVDLGGTGIGAPTGPVASLAPGSLAFGMQQTGTTSPPQGLTLQNTGDATLSIAGIATTGDFAQTNNCGATLAPAASCAISVTFTPMASGPHSGTVVVTSDGAGSPSAAALGGTGGDGVPTATPLPSLSQWGLILLGMLLAALAWRQTRMDSRR